MSDANVSPADVDLLESWLKERARAIGERDRHQQVVDGYDRMLEGWRLIHGQVPGSVVQSWDAASETTGATSDDGTATESKQVKPVKPTWPSVRAILQDVSPGAKAPTVRDIANSIDALGWRLGSDSPERVIRKALRAAQKRGEVSVHNIDGRTNGYRLSATKTSGGVAPTTPPDPIPTKAVEGGEPESAPQAPTYHEDHNPTFTGRNDRDHPWNAENPVGTIQF